MNNVSEYTAKNIILTSEIGKPEWAATNTSSPGQKKLDPLYFLRELLNKLEVRDPKLAQRLCRFIPAQCPFERQVKLFRYTFHIPPMCKLNPLYEEIVALRFRALCYLADECGEDVSAYC